MATVPQRLRWRVFQRDGFRCTYCGRSAKDGVELQADHVISVADGGATTLDNLTTACWECNSGKSTDSLGLEPIDARTWGEVCRTRLWVVAYGRRFGHVSYYETCKALERNGVPRPGTPALPPRRRDDVRWWNAVAANPEVALVVDRWLTGVLDPA